MSLGRFVNFAAGEPCPVCGCAERRGKNRCAASPDGLVVMCGRQSAGSFRASRNGDFWLHRVGPARPAAEVLPAWSAVRRAAEQPTPRPDFGPPAWRWQRAVSLSAACRLAESLGLPVAALRRLGLGWASGTELRAAGTRCRGGGCWAFPMSDPSGRVVGVRLRSPDGGKFSLSGSDGSGLFVPAGLTPGRPLFACEGPTSCAALLAMGLDAVGRPNCSAGAGYLSALARRLRPAAVAIVGDNDAKPDGRWPGLEGAERVAAEVRRVCRDVRVILPPAGVKDVRDWLAAGAAASDVMAAARRATAGVRRAG